jgi:hypothetical protein
MGALRREDPASWRHPILMGTAGFPARVVYHDSFLLSEHGGRVLVPADCGDADRTKLEIDLTVGGNPPGSINEQPVTWGAAPGRVAVHVSWRPEVTAVAVDEPFFIGEHWQSKMYLQVACQRVATSTLVHLWMSRNNIDDY